ncbi:hypothetical protein AJ85_10170 [Alkalihalobacillus alcalophilus ATCC 27647 = CGMCC 1.3604]|uniref:DUF3169 domain-containing protein n=1 Tax=Alkalihalobacillus alcalophilus ATCC 27647 = CGMCC 1.3604 TaxID=1218173 RepID=A0A094WQ51_ALKAL|nr:DUF3169 family protein [Alkalihalobacillus alcalophilus]KGA98158.1 hypothetical protein BALCAV_0205820 [Alkalihalobacillus alcalophilus ATCC 27647 = CGMCC 1.3604]MED1560848.1 DUF3169 family protein [Alkalihalobacillus alcalophilus]THG90543.1 hypothetical protein AJ85_10170 [Alkalihalobacillus alcalophilus ATCC 27647 = CGMCC 1.3604]
MKKNKLKYFFMGILVAMLPSIIRGAWIYLGIDGLQMYILFPFDILYGLTLIIYTYLFITFFQKWKQYHKVNEKEILNEDERGLRGERILFQINTITIIQFVLAVMYGAASISQFRANLLEQLHERLFYNFNLGALLIVISYIMYYYNKKRLNEANENDQSDLDDEGLRYVAYKSSFYVLRKMQKIFLIVIIGLVICTQLFDTVSMFTIFIVGSLWILMNFLNHFEGIKEY